MNATAIQSDWVGQVIDGRFTLLQWLGGSERSGVFLTELPGPQGLKGAIKLTFAESDEDIEAHIAGWAATRTLSHPNLRRLLHTGRCEMHDGVLLYAVSEYADEVLSQILPERALTPEEAREMLGPVLDVLGYLHGKGLVHGHLKPSNLLVVDDHLKLSGDCLQAAGNTGKPTSELSIYDAPERASGVISPASDVWSLGVTLVEALTQHPPIWDKTKSEDPVVPESIPQPLAGIARGCLRADPMSRSTLADVKNRLEGKLPAGKPAENSASKFPMPLLVGAVLIPAIFVFVWMARSHKSETPIAVAPAETHQQSAPAAAAPQAQEQPAPAQKPPLPETAAQETPAPVPESAPPETEQRPEPAPPPATAKSSAPAAAPGDGAVVEQVQPDVLPKALASIHGKFDVRIRVTVDTAGNVTGAAFDPEGPSPYFANAAMKAAHQFKFKPGQPGTSVVQFRFTSAGAEISTNPGQ